MLSPRLFSRGINPICIRLRLPDGVCNPVRNLCFRRYAKHCGRVANPVRHIEKDKLFRVRCFQGFHQYFPRSECVILGRQRVCSALFERENILTASSSSARIRISLSLSYDGNCRTSGRILFRATNMPPLRGFTGLP